MRARAHAYIEKLGEIFTKATFSTETAEKGSENDMEQDIMQPFRAAGERLETKQQRTFYKALCNVVEPSARQIVASGGTIEDARLYAGNRMLVIMKALQME
jgi:hypothetical protein